MQCRKRLSFTLRNAGNAFSSHDSHCRIESHGVCHSTLTLTLYTHQMRKETFLVISTTQRPYNNRDESSTWHMMWSGFLYQIGQEISNSAANFTLMWGNPVSDDSKNQFLLRLNWNLNFNVSTFKQQIDISLPISQSIAHRKNVKLSEFESVLIFKDSWSSWKTCCARTHLSEIRRLTRSGRHAWIERSISHRVEKFHRVWSRKRQQWQWQKRENSQFCRCLFTPVESESESAYLYSMAIAVVEHVSVSVFSKFHSSFYRLALMDWTSPPKRLAHTFNITFYDGSRPDQAEPHFSFLYSLVVDFFFLHIPTHLPFFGALLLSVLCCVAAFEHCAKMKTHNM